MKEKDVYSELASIRELMERSTKFISLSGLSGVLAGIYALAGSYAASRFCLPANWWGRSDRYESVDVAAVAAIAVLVLLLSLVTGFLLSRRKASRSGQAVWTPVSRRFLFSMFVPLLTGGGFILALMWREDWDLIAAATLVFYGLSLVAGSQYTFSDIKWLGFLEIILGLAALMHPDYGLVLWTVGFGILHIVYGTLMHFKYER